MVQIITSNNKTMRILLIAFLAIYLGPLTVSGQSPAQTDNRIYDIINSVSQERIEADIRRLANFGTRHTLSDTLSNIRGIGAARRWIKSEFEKISSDCGGCLEVVEQRGLVKAGVSRRIPNDTWVVNEMAIKRGTQFPNRYIIMSGDIDSRISDPLNATDDSPGANDNASGMAGVLEAARVLSKYDFPTSIIFVGLSGEEQGLFGGKHMAAEAKKAGWDIVGVLNNDMIGNIKGVDGIIDNRSFRIFSETSSSDQTKQQIIWNRFYGGEVDGPSRQLARYVHRMTSTYMPEMKPKLVYRLDRFGRGGHHRPFNDEGYAGIRIMETHENYDMQHQDIRTENGIDYGDVIEGVNFEYAAKLTAVNAINLASIAWAPHQPTLLEIGGGVQPSTRLRWTVPVDETIAGFKIYWRDTTAPQWENSVFVPAGIRDHTLEKVVIDNFLFGVASVNKEGHESVVVYPRTLIPRR